MTPPSPFVVRWLAEVRAELGARRDALDLAMGTGRHARAAAALGFRVHGVDRDLDRLRRAKAGGLAARLWAADLEVSPLPRDRFDLLICTRYLQRSLWPGLRGAVRPGGFVIYETFTVAQLAHGAGPRSPDHLLRHGELRRVFDGWQLWHAREHRSPDAVAQVVARKPWGASAPLETAPPAAGTPTPGGRLGGNRSRRRRFPCQTVSRQGESCRGAADPGRPAPGTP